MPYIFDGSEAKNIDLPQFPDAAWTFDSGLTDDDARLAAYYNTVAWIYRCTTIRANTLSAMPWVIGRGENEAWNYQEEAPQQLDWLSDFVTLLYLTEAALVIGGEAFWFTERNARRPLNVKWLAPHSVIPQWSASLGLTGFKRMLGNGQHIMLDVDEVTYFRLPNPLHETKPGTSPVEAASQASNILYSVDRFSEAFFKRGAIKATLLTVDGNPPRAEMEKLEAWWKRFFSGISKAWETAAVRAGVTPVIVGEGLESLSNGELTRERKEDIATAMGVPNSLVMSNAANFATAQADRLNFYEMTIIPESRVITNTINDQLLSPLGYNLQFNPQEMPVFQENETERSQSLVDLRNAGLPLETALTMLGYEVPQDMPIEEVAPVEVQAPIVDDTAAVEDEKSRFRRWAKKRRRPDPDDYASDVISYADKAAILYELREDGSADDATFPTVTWDDYAGLVADSQSANITTGPGR